MSKVRLARETDWLAVLALLDQVKPDTKETNRAWWRERQLFTGHTLRRRHYVVEQPGKGGLIAYAGVEEGPEPRQFRLSLVMKPELLKNLGQKLYKGLMIDLTEMGAEVITAREEIFSPIQVPSPSRLL